MASALTASLSDILDMNHCWHVSHCTWHPASRWPCAALAALGDFGLASGLLLRPLAAMTSFFLVKCWRSIVLSAELWMRKGFAISTRSTAVPLEPPEPPAAPEPPEPRPAGVGLDISSTIEKGRTPAQRRKRRCQASGRKAERAGVCAHRRRP